MGLLIGLRPWSWTAGVVPVLITAKLEGKFLSTDTLRLLGMVVCSQSAGNVINSYFDHLKKIDTKEEAGDSSVVAGHITPEQCAPVGIACVAGSALCAFSYVKDIPVFRNLFLLGTGLAVFYTAPPFYLKYHALGDLVILGAFGPTLMQACAAALTGAMDASINAYSLPITLLTEGILWANNARDIEADSRAGVTTVCAKVGFDASKSIFQGMVYAAYAACAWLSWQRKSPGMLLPLLTLPIAVDTCAQFKKGKESMLEAPDRTAQLHLPFGLLMLAGLALDENVFCRWFK